MERQITHVSIFCFFHLHVSIEKSNDNNETFFHTQIGNKANMDIYVIDKRKRNVINNSFIPPLNIIKTT